VWPLARLLRAVAKHLLIRANLFGRPIIVIGAAEKGERAICALKENPDLGLIPVAVFTDDLHMRGRRLEGVPILGSINDAVRRPMPYRVGHAMVALSRREVGPSGMTKIVHSLAKRYPTLHIFPDLEGLATLWARTLPIGQHLVLEIPHARFNRRDAMLKRTFDLVISIPLFLLTLPVILTAAVLVKLFSPGPALFSHEREGRGGRRVRMWKIRTMVPDAEERLADYLRENPAARFEWQRYVKLRKDPRVVPVVGSFLRRSSIDELPQLWNVIRGEMSLVGPRLFPRYHVERFERDFRRLRRQVPPGMTGLWQVNHRSSGDLSLQQTADSYYVHNWSLWLDFWILLRTVRIVLTGAGAH
jgi:Undecaprenyl-phosphate galactose phosphotransferase WbaP